MAFYKAESKKNYVFLELFSFEMGFFWASIIVGFNKFGKHWMRLGTGMLSKWKWMRTCAHAPAHRMNPIYDNRDNNKQTFKNWQLHLEKHGRHLSRFHFHSPIDLNTHTRTSMPCENSTTMLCMVWWNKGRWRRKNDIYRISFSQKDCAYTHT